jgi:hypothetical protein
MLEVTVVLLMINPAITWYILKYLIYIFLHLLLLRRIFVLQLYREIVIKTIEETILGLKRISVHSL